MKTITLNFVEANDALYFVPEKEAGEFPPEIVKSYRFDVEEYDGNKAIRVGQQMNGVNLITAAGVGDLDAVDAARGKFIGIECIKGWDRQTADGADLPVTPENVGTLPVPVLIQFGYRMSRAPRLTPEAIDALKKGPKPSTANT